MTLERCRETRLLNYLRTQLPQHWFIRKTHGSAFSRDLPDLLVSGAGRAWALEVKTFTGKLTPGQRASLLRIDRARGAFAPLVARIRCDHPGYSTRANHSLRLEYVGIDDVKELCDWTSLLETTQLLINAHNIWKSVTD